MAIVYQHIRLDTNEIFYIGVGVNKYRAINKVKRNQFWKRIVNKTEYKIEILYDDMTYDDALKKEIELIQKYGRRDLGLGTLCNLTDGGEGRLNAIVSEETRDKFRGSNNYMFNRTHTPEVRERMSIIIKEKMKNIITRNKIRDKALGRPRSDALKLKMTICSLKSKKVYEIINGELIMYNSIREASKKLHFSRINFTRNPQHYNLFTFDQLSLEYQESITSTVVLK